jgi:hypothetical protein
MSTREAPPPPKRSSRLGSFSLFSRSKTDPSTPPSKSTKATARVRDPVEVSETPVKLPRKDTERPRSSHHSSNEGRDPMDRPHRSRRESHGQRSFKSQAEEAEYYKQKEKRRAARKKEYEMSGGRDGGVSFAPFVDELPPPPPEPFEPDPEPVFEDEPEVSAPSPYMDDAKAELGVDSTSSAERRERRRSRRTSGAVDERPRTRRITVTEKDRPAPSRRVESDRPRTRGHDEERPRPRRGETERRSSGRTSKKKEESGGLKSLFGGLKKRIT